MAAASLRVGLIGAGANTRLHHIPGFREIDGVELVAVCNRSSASGERVSADFGIPRVETDPKALLEDPSIDAICIGTWPNMHCELSVGALDAGKHVLCEARMATNAAEARAMLEASRRHPELVAQLVPAPFDLRSWRTVRRLLTEGTLGELREVHVTMLGGGGLDPGTPLHWRERAEYSGVNTMTLGILAETVQRWLGPTERVLADAAVFTGERPDPERGGMARITIPDSLGVFARMANGSRATYLVSMVAAHPAVANGIAIHGTRATLRWLQRGDVLTLAHLDGSPQPLEPDAGTDGTWRVEADFIDSIHEGAAVELTSFEDGVEYMRFTEAVWRSWSEGRPVELAEV